MKNNPFLLYYDSLFFKTFPEKLLVGTILLPILMLNFITGMFSKNLKGVVSNMLPGVSPMDPIFARSTLWHGHRGMGDICLPSFVKYGSQDSFKNEEKMVGYR